MCVATCCVLEGLVAGGNARVDRSGGELVRQLGAKLYAVARRTADEGAAEADTRPDPELEEVR